MLTLKLWTALQKPPLHHPLFKRAFIARTSPLLRYIRLAVVVSAVSLLCLLSLTPAAVHAQFAVIVGSLPLLVYGYHNTFYGALWSASIGAAINNEQERGTYELLCVMPGGALSVSWAYCAANLHRRGTMLQVHDNLRSILGLLAIFVALLALLTGFGLVVVRIFSVLSPLGVAQDVFVGCLVVLMALGVLYVDHLQTVVTSSLIGMSTPAFAAGRFEGRMWAVSLFLLVQLVVYGSFMVVGFILLPALLGRADAGWLTLVSWAVRLTFLLTLREWLIVQGWRLLIHGLNTESREPELLLSE